MMIRGFFEMRDARLIAAVMAGLLISLTLGLGVTRTALAVSDYDGDGATTEDCKPFDAAVAPGRPDKPDLQFEDTNCDGIDGTIALSGTAEESTVEGGDGQGPDLRWHDPSGHAG